MLEWCRRGAGSAARRISPPPPRCCSASTFTRRWRRWVVPYTPIWSPVAHSLGRGLANGVPGEGAELGLRRAVAARKIRGLRRAAPNHDRRGPLFYVPSLEVPVHLGPGDLDWSRSCPLRPWSIGPVGPQYYTWTGGRKDRPIDLIEVSSSDVSKILCGDLADIGRAGARRTTGT